LGLLKRAGFSSSLNWPEKTLTLTFLTGFFYRKLLLNGDPPVEGLSPERNNDMPTDPQTPTPLKSGDRDETFGFLGTVTGPANAIAHSIVSSDNGMLTYAIENGGEFQIHRNHVDGDRDTTFGTDGIVTGQFESGRRSKPCRLILQERKILVIGDILTEQGKPGAPAVLRLNDSGSPDLVFGTIQLPSPAFSSNYDSTEGCLQHDGKILILTQKTDAMGIGNLGQLTRLKKDGLGDGSDGTDLEFGEQGKVEVSFGEHLSRMINVVVQPDSKIVVGGNYVTVSASVSRIVLARFDIDGALDKSFGDDGYVWLGPVDGRHELGELIVQDDGKLLCVGMTGHSDALVMRFDANGKPDPTFNGGHEVLTALGHQNASWRALSIQPSDKKIVVAGWTPGFPSSMFWGRLLSDGTFDTGFGNAGWIKSSVPGIPYSVAIQNGGRIIVAGIRENARMSVVCGVQG
jgi:uncharacterized delta-60 repeat protein